MSEQTSQGSEKGLNLRLGFLQVGISGCRSWEYVNEPKSLLGCSCAEGFFLSLDLISLGICCSGPFLLSYVAGFKESSGVPFGVGQMGLRNASPQFRGWHGQTLAASSLSIPLHKPCLSIRDATRRGMQVPLGEPLDP